MTVAIAKKSFNQLSMVFLSVIRLGLSSSWRFQENLVTLNAIDTMVRHIHRGFVETLHPRLDLVIDSPESSKLCGFQHETLLEGRIEDNFCTLQLNLHILRDDSQWGMIITVTIAMEL